MASKENLELLDLLPSAKRRRLTDFNKCLICQLHSREKLRRATATCIQKLIDALQYRHDEVYVRLKGDLSALTTVQVQWHSKCYAIYTSKENLRHVDEKEKKAAETFAESSQLSKKKSEASTSVVLRSQSPTFDWSLCIICKKRTHKKVKDLITVRTLQSCQSIVKAALSKGDDDMINLISTVNNDLISAEARYHRSCHASYVSKTNLMACGRSKEKEESVFDRAFKGLVQEISGDLIGGKAYDMTQLLDNFKAHLCREGHKLVDSYSSQRLKERLKNYFGSSITFHKPHRKNNAELIYSSSVSLQDVINCAFEVNNQSTNGSSKEHVSNTKEADEDKLRQLYKCAKIIKSDIRNCKGISIHPPDISDLSLTKARSLIPESLYWLLRWVIAKPYQNEQDDFTSPACKDLGDERHVLMLCQDIVHCATHARIKMPKHVALGVAVHHMTRSKQLVTLLSRMGHCETYENIQAMETSHAREILVKSDLYGVVTPSNIVPGVFVQVAGDNNDLNEETLDGKNTTHGTTLVLFQKGCYGPIPKQNVVGDHSRRLRSLELPTSCKSLREFSAYGQRPTVIDFQNKIKAEWFQISENLHSASRDMDRAWAIMRMIPMKLFEVDLISTDKQTVPGWSSFNAVVHPKIPVRTNIGYCPIINASPTEYNTVYTVMKNVQGMMASLSQKDSVITFDLAIYMKAKEIQWRQPEEFQDMVIRMGGFHIALNFLAVLGKKYDMSGIEDILVESGLYGRSTANSLLKGKSYNRGVRAHKIIMEAMFRLEWNAFSQWLANRLDSNLNKESIMQQAMASQLALRENKEVENSIKHMIDIVTTLDPEFTQFEQEGRAQSHLFSFWCDYASMVQLLLEFIKAERTGDWPLHLSATAGMVPYFFAMDRPNYSRWLVVYLSDMNQLPETHPEVHSEFMSGNHAISRSNQPFAQVWTDMALEQSINLDSKTSGGITGISQKPGALQRWFLSCHERAAIAASVKEMCSLYDTGRVGNHKEATPKRLERDENDVQKVLNVFTSEMMINPFHHVEDDQIAPLTNIATGVRMPEDAAMRLLNSLELGSKEMKKFTEERLNSNVISFWAPLTKLKLTTFASLAKKTVKISDEKVVTVSADRDLFGRLVIAAKAREFSLQEVLSYELSSVPFSLAHHDGSLRKTNKSMLLAELEKLVDVQPNLPDNTNISTAHIYDAMAMIQSMKITALCTFGELATRLYNLVTAPLGKNGCQRVDIVFDTYLSLSIKAAEREKRGASEGLEVQIHSHSTKLPKQWSKYISNIKNKSNLCVFLSEALCHCGRRYLRPDHQLVIGGGFTNPRRSVIVTKGQSEELDLLLSDHEEADTRQLLHAQHASHVYERIIIISPDTDVAILCAAHFDNLKCIELWFRTGVKDKLRFIPVHTLTQKLGLEVCKALPGLHALTGCDSTSALAGLGKKKALTSLLRNKEHQITLSKLGENAELSNSVFKACEAFICSLYSHVKDTETNIDELRYYLFCQKGQRNENLPPTSDSLLQHIKRACYQVYVWKKSLEPIQNLQPPDQHGWQVRDGCLHPVLMTNPPAPLSLLQLTVCHCKKSLCRRANCACRKKSLPCIEGCACFANETCENPRTSSVIDLDERSDDDNDDNDGEND